MKKADKITLVVMAAVILGFAFIPGAWDWFIKATTKHGLLMSFFKFAILGTFGEMLSLRIKEGVYLKPGFGLVPKMLVWGGCCHRIGNDHFQNRNRTTTGRRLPSKRQSGGMVCRQAQLG